MDPRMRESCTAMTMKRLRSRLTGWSPTGIGVHPSPPADDPGLPRPGHVPLPEPPPRSPGLLCPDRVPLHLDSTSPRIRIICSSVYRVLFMKLSSSSRYVTGYSHSFWSSFGGGYPQRERHHRRPQRLGHRTRRPQVHHRPDQTHHHSQRSDRGNSAGTTPTSDLAANRGLPAAGARES